MEQVRLRIAFLWQCPGCGHSSIEIPPVACDLEDDEREEAYRALYDLEPWQEMPDDWREFQFSHVPCELSCSSCGEVYETEQEEEDWDT